MAFDMHAHWTPRGLMAQSAKNKDWYGWRLITDQNGQERAMFAIGERILGRAVSKSSILDPMARHQMRKEQDSITMEALMLSGTFYPYHLDEAQASAFCRELNEELAEVQKAHPGIYRGIAVLPMHHPKAALREMEYAAGKLGLGAVVTLSNVHGLNLDEPAVLPILEEAARNDLAIFVHPTIWDWGTNRFPRYYFSNSFGAPLESSNAVMSVVYSGLMDRYPNLRIMFTQGGGWIHYGVGRFDLRYHQREDARPMAEPPAAYLKKMYFDCLVHDDDSFHFLLKRATPDRVMTGTDYPAGGDIIGGAVKWIKEGLGLSEDVQKKVLYQNAKRFWKITD